MSTLRSTFNQESEQPAEARAAAYALIAAGFRYPTSIPLEELAAPALWDETLAPLMRGEGDLSDALRALRRAIDETGRDVADEGRGRTVLENQYAALFGHAVRGACPPYELEYGPGEIVQRASDLADIAGFYTAFGMELAADSDRADHVTAQCEFMSLLCVKECVAAQDGWTDRVELCRTAQRSFLKDHLSRWLPAFAQRICDHAASSFYASLARLSRALIEAECGRFNLPAGPTQLALRPSDPERDTSIECGPEDAGVPGSGNRLVPLNVASP